MSLRIKLLLFISFLFIVSIGNAIFTFKLESYSQEKSKWVDRTNEIIINVKELLSYIKDAETGQRGFLLTQNSDYLEPYYHSLVKTKKHLSNLKQLTINHPKQEKLLLKLEKPMKLKFNELALTIKLKQHQNGKGDVALMLMKKNMGKKYMDEIREILKEYTDAEIRLLEERKGDYREYRGRISTLIVTEIIFFILLAILTVSFLNKNLFNPLRLLLLYTQKMENGHRIDVSDVVAKDEIGHLLSSFYKMNEKIYERTQELDHKAHHDELTGLKNRVKMSKEIQELIGQLKEYKTKFAVFFIDLNKFKQLNDTMGHDAGDIMLRETAARLKESVRSQNSVYRLGGDEFLILVPNISDVSKVKNIVLNILEAMKAPLIVQGKQVEISLSIGIAISPDDTKNSDEILKYADIAMYEAKHDKDCSYKFFDKSMLKRSDDLS